MTKLVRPFMFVHAPLNTWSGVTLWWPVQDEDGRTASIALAVGAVLTLDKLTLFVEDGIVSWAGQ